VVVATARPPKGKEELDSPEKGRNSVSWAERERALLPELRRWWEAGEGWSPYSINSNDGDDDDVCFYRLKCQVHRIKWNKRWECNLSKIPNSERKLVVFYVTECLSDRKVRGIILGCLESSKMRKDGTVAARDLVRSREVGAEAWRSRMAGIYRGDAERRERESEMICRKTRVFAFPLWDPPYDIPEDMRPRGDLLAGEHDDAVMQRCCTFVTSYGWNEFVEEKEMWEDWCFPPPPPSWVSGEWWAMDPPLARPREIECIPRPLARAAYFYGGLVAGQDEEYAKVRQRVETAHIRYYFHYFFSTEEAILYLLQRNGWDQLLVEPADEAALQEFRLRIGRTAPPSSPPARGCREEEMQVIESEEEEDVAAFVVSRNGLRSEPEVDVSFGASLPAKKKRQGPTMLVMDDFVVSMDELMANGGRIRDSGDDDLFAVDRALHSNGATDNAQKLDPETLVGVRDEVRKGEEIGLADPTVFGWLHFGKIPVSMLEDGARLHKGKIRVFYSDIERILLHMMGQDQVYFNGVARDNPGFADPLAIKVISRTASEIARKQKESRGRLGGGMFSHQMRLNGREGDDSLGKGTLSIPIEDLLDILPPCMERMLAQAKRRGVALKHEQRKSWARFLKHLGAPQRAYVSTAFPLFVADRTKKGEKCDEPAFKREWNWTTVFTSEKYPNVSCSKIIEATQKDAAGKMMCICPHAQAGKFHNKDPRLLCSQKWMKGNPEKAENLRTLYYPSQLVYATLKGGFRSRREHLEVEYEEKE